LLGISNSGGIQLSYWGEIVTGPFISHGIQADDKTLFQKANDKYKNKSYDVTFHNLEKIFRKISPGDDDEELERESEGRKSILELISFHFISPLTFGRAATTSKYGTKFFDVAYFGNNMAQHILPTLTPVLASDAIVLAENAL
jgi:dynein assembly factor 3